MTRSQRILCLLGFCGLLFGGLALARFAGPTWLAVVGTVVAFGGGAGLVLYFLADAGGW